MLKQSIKKMYAICKTILSYCLKCWKNTEGKKTNVEKIKTEELSFHQTVQFVVIKLRFIKEQEASSF